MRSIIGLKCPCLGCQTWEKVLDFRLLNLIATVIDFCTPPTEQGRGHPRSATVRVLATLRQFLREGTPWRSLKATADKVSGSTLRRHLEQWAGTGVLAQVHAVLVGMVRGDPTLILDTCSVRAKRGGDLTGPNPTDRGKRGTKYPIAGDGVPVACAATAANINDTLVFERLFLAAFAVMARIQTVFADKGYDAEHHRDLCRKFDAEPCIHKRGPPAGPGGGKGARPGGPKNAWVPEKNPPRSALRPPRLHHPVTAPGRMHLPGCREGGQRIVKTASKRSAGWICGEYGGRNISSTPSGTTRSLATCQPAPSSTKMTCLSGRPRRRTRPGAR